MKLFFPKQSFLFDFLKEIEQEHKEMVSLLVEFGNNFNNFEAYSKKAKEIECRADEKTHTAIDWLNKTFITPIDREDIYLLVHKLDDIVDLIENVIHNINIYGITKKTNIIEEFISIIDQTSSYLGQLIDHLSEAKYTPQFKKTIVKIHELEDKADAVFSRALTNLFLEEKDPIIVIKLKDIFEDLENVMDKYQNVSDIIGSIVVKSS